MEKRFQSDQFHGLGDTGIANHHEAALGVFALFSQLHQGAETGGIEKVDFTQIKDSRESVGLQNIHHVSDELLFRVGIQLAGEVKHQAAILLLKPSTERNRQSLQFSDGTRPPILRRRRAKCSDAPTDRPRINVDLTSAKRNGRNDDRHRGVQDLPQGDIAHQTAAAADGPSLQRCGR